MFNDGGGVWSREEPWQPLLGRDCLLRSGLALPQDRVLLQAAKSLEERDLKSCPGSRGHLH